MKLKLTLVTLALAVICAIPMHGTENSVAPSQQTEVADNGPMGENSPLLLFVAVYVNSEVQHVKTPWWNVAASFQKWRVHRYAYNLAYKQSVAAGFSQSGARKYAAALVDDAPLSAVTCADYANPPAHCATAR